MDTADSVMDTKRKVEFGVQQIIYKVKKLFKIFGKNDKTYSHQNFRQKRPYLNFHTL